jgi:hypothetical protein
MKEETACFRLTVKYDMFFSKTSELSMAELVDSHNECSKAALYVSNLGPRISAASGLDHRFEITLSNMDHKILVNHLAVEMTIGLGHFRYRFYITPPWSRDWASRKHACRRCPRNSQAFCLVPQSVISSIVLISKLSTSSPLMSANMQRGGPEKTDKKKRPVLARLAVR